MPLDGHTVTVL